MPYQSVMNSNIQESFFQKNRNFHSSIKHDVEQGRKAMNLIYKRIRNLNLPIDLQIKLFDHTITPILLYGCVIGATKLHKS